MIKKYLFTFMAFFLFFVDAAQAEQRVLHYDSEYALSWEDRKWSLSSLSYGERIGGYDLPDAIEGRSWTAPVRFWFFKGDDCNEQDLRKMFRAIGKYNSYIFSNIEACSRYPLSCPGIGVLYRCDFIGNFEEGTFIVNIYNNYWTLIKIIDNNVDQKDIATYIEEVQSFIKPVFDLNF